MDVEGLLGSAVMRLGPLSYQRSIHEPPESYSVTYMRHRLVRITILYTFDPIYLLDQGCCPLPFPLVLGVLKDKIGVLAPGLGLRIIRS